MQKARMKTGCKQKKRQLYFCLSRTLGGQKSEL